MVPILREQPHFRETPDGVRLIATRDSATREFMFPPSQYRRSESSMLEELLIESEGTLYTFSIVHLGRDKAPYALGMVDFASGIRVFGVLLLEKGVRPAIGGRVKTVAHNLPDGTPDFAFSFISEQP